MRRSILLQRDLVVEIVSVLSKRKKPFEVGSLRVIYRAE